MPSLIRASIALLTICSAACGTSNSQGPANGGTSGDIEETSGDSGTTTMGSSSTSEPEGWDSAGSTTGLDEPVPSTSGSTSSGEETGTSDQPPELPPGAYIRGTLVLLGGETIEVDASASHQMIGNDHVCSASMQAGDEVVSVVLRWPDTAVLVPGEQTPWSLSGEGPRLFVQGGISTAGWVIFVDVGEDDPSAVAGYGHNDLDPGDEGDEYQAFEDLEFRCPLR